MLASLEDRSWNCGLAYLGSPRSWKERGEVFSFAIQSWFYRASFHLHTCQRNRSPSNRRVVLVVTVLFCNGLVVPAGAQHQQPPEDPEDEKQVGLWLDQGISADLSPDKSLEFEFHERFDEGASNLFEYFFQGASLSVYGSGSR